MLVFRIAGEKHVRDLSGLGARRFGGRWNLPGTAVVYASESRSLAMLEFLLHVSFPNLPQDIRIAALKIPEEVDPEILPTDLLPKNWRNYPAPEKLAKLGTDWARSNRSLVLRVPSAVIDQEYNLLINPAHPDMGWVIISRIADLRFDSRLVRKREA